MTKGKKLTGVILPDAQKRVAANLQLLPQNAEKEKQTAELLLENKELAIESGNRLKEISDYKHALDESSILAITNQKGIITYVNDNFCKISKYSAAELIGQDHKIINSGYHSKEFIRNLWVTIANAKIWRGELKNKAKDGTIYWVDTTIVPFLDEQGKPYQYAAIRADITPRKAAEKELKLLNDELEKRVKERTEDLESFSYSVSHDLRAPLRAVNGYARMFKIKFGTKFDEEANRLLNNIVNNATRMGQLIDDLLTFSRLGRREMTRMNIPMHEIVSNLCRELKAEQVNRNIEFNIRELPSVKADNIGMKQVWLNLVSNAIKYTRLKEKAIIEIGSEIKGDDIIYYIKDNGAGFDMRYVNKLFNIFQRLHSEDEFEGTGIGLAIVQRIMNKHGGKVWAESILNEETIFYFSLNKA
jgi:PAS domain S-box-containing protein